MDNRAIAVVAASTLEGKQVSMEARLAHEVVAVSDIETVVEDGFTLPHNGGSSYFGYISRFRPCRRPRVCWLVPF